MNKDKLRNIIELIVRKEIKKQLSEIFINEKEEVKLSEVISKPKPKKVVKKKPYKQYTKNEALNEVLNNTKPLGSSGQTDEYPTLGGGVLGSDNMADVLGYGDLGMGQNKERAREMGAVDTIRKTGVSVESVPEDVQNALTRDYSDLMKAINKKKSGEDNYVGIGFPLDYTDTQGFFRKTKTVLEQSRHNLRNLLLTTPGERIMQPDFGSQLKSIVFEQGENVPDRIEEAVNQAVDKFLSYIIISGVYTTQDGNQLNVQVEYSVPLNPDTIEILNFDFRIGE